jgi:undecaprenyl-diphosphatase
VPFPEPVLLAVTTPPYTITHPADSGPRRSEETIKSDYESGLIVSLMTLDRFLFWQLYEVAPSWLVLPITYLGTWGALWILISVLLIMCARGASRRTGAALAVGITSSFLFVDLSLKPMVSRVRPCETLHVQIYDVMTSPHSHSFPSGHASMAFASAWILGARFRRLRLPLLILAAMIAVSRVTVGAHWPSDIAVGSILGSIIGIGVAKLFATPPPESGGSNKAD